MPATFPKDSVCKPCWELKYCPYGHMVEYFPHSHLGRSIGDYDTTARFSEVNEELKLKGAWNMDEVEEYFRMLHMLDPAANSEITAFEPEDVACRVFGHVCPVFFCQSPGTETKQGRIDGRYISRAIMLQVVRRDGHICQICRINVPDDKIQFDHIIPLSKGGPTTVQNLRVLCRKCNQEKSDSLKEHLAF